jgi:hypothetical protein
LPKFTAYKLLEACARPGCPLCRLEQDSVVRYLENQLYENVNSPKWRERLRQSLGFCHEHAWLAATQRLGDALGFSIIYHDLINSILKQLEGETASPPLPRRIALPRKLADAARQTIENTISALTPRRHCPVCEERDDLSRATIAVLVQELEEPQFRAALESSDGLCIPHLKRVLQHTSTTTSYETLLSIHRPKLSSLAAELAEFIRKNDYQNIGEGFGPEGDAWRRAIAGMVGSRKEK